MTDGARPTMPLHRLHPQVESDLPRPPFSVVLERYMIAGVRYDRSAVRHLVPEELALPPVVDGFIASGRATQGWGVAPFSNFYLALAVEGLPSPDGTPAHFRPLNIYSPRAALVFRQHYNAHIKDGTHRHWQTGDDLFCECTAADGFAAGFALRPSPGAKAEMASGVHHYLGQDGEGEVTSFHTSYTSEFIGAEVCGFQVSGPDAARRLPQPEFTWAIVAGRMPITIGEPRGSPFAAVAGTPGAATLTSLLARIGLAAACVDPDGVVLSANAGARRLFREAGVAQRDRLRLPAGLGQGGAAALHRAEIGLPVIAETFPLDEAIAGRRALLVLLRDPGAPGQGDPTVVLQLLGLTPSESRLAAAMGQGLGVGEAAARVGIAVSTARSQLKVVYGKLGIGRQSELSRLVATIRPGGG